MCILLVLVVPIEYAAGIDVGGGFGIDVTVVSNASDTNGDDQPITDEIYLHSYVTLIDAKREDNYAFAGEEVNYEVYVQSEKNADNVIIEINDREIECKEKKSKLSDGDDLGDEFSEQAEYDKDIMDYYECSLIVDEAKGEEEIKITAWDDDIILATDNEDWAFNPSLTVEIDDNLELTNTNEVMLNITSCDKEIELYPDQQITVCVGSIIRII